MCEPFVNLHAAKNRCIANGLIIVKMSRCYDTYYITEANRAPDRPGSDMDAIKRVVDEDSPGRLDLTIGISASYDDITIAGVSHLVHGLVGPRRLGP